MMPAGASAQSAEPDHALFGRAAASASRQRGRAHADAGAARWTVLDPPYVLPTALPDADRLDDPAPRGRVLLCLARTDDTTTSLRAATATVHHINPRSPRALVAGNALVLPTVWGAMRDVGFRVALLSAQPTADMVRSALASGSSFGGDVLRWLIAANVAKDSRFIEHFRTMVTAYDGHGDPAVARVDAQSRVTRTMRRHFKNAGLAPPGRWCRLYWLLWVALLIQGQPDKPAAAIAEANGFSDDAHLRRVLREWFASSPEEIRACLGWEWLLWAAIEKKNLVVRTRH